MAIKSIAEYLKKITGLNSGSVGMSVVEQAVNKRMLACNINTHLEYYNILTNSNNELSFLIDQVMIPETWFFRGAETFKYLEAHLAAKVCNAAFNKIRILAVPCATGEEPYSVAITLAECGYSPGQYVIDAVDIAHESLRLAKEAVFTAHSFRDDNKQIKQRYFRQVEAGFKLDNSITEKVSFSCGNIFELEVEQENRYDIVFCRNLLIYFDKDTQRKALNIIAKLMVDDGVLFIGHGEAGCILNSQFKRINAPGSFAFSKSAHKQKNSCANSKLMDKKILHNKVTKTITSEALFDRNDVENLTPKKSNDCDIEKAITLANEGNFDKAIEKCKKLISSTGVSADALCLLGVIHDAIGERVEAVNYYKRALHLTPDHYQSLMHLASHAERDGDKSKASQYRIEAMQSKKISN